MSAGATARRLGARALAEGRPRLRRIQRHLLPAGDCQLSRYVVRHLFTPHGRRARWLAPIADRLGGTVGARLLSVGRAGRDPGAAADPAWLARLTDELGRGWLAEAVRGTPLATVVDPGRWILVAPRPGGPAGRAAVFAFPRRGATPVAVMKVRARDEGAPDLGGEARALERLAHLSEDVVETVPRLLAHRRESGREVLVTTALPGRSGYVALHRGRAPVRDADRQLEAVAEWLARLHRGTRQGTRPAAESLERVGAAAGAGRRAEADDWWRGLADRLEGVCVPAAIAHGDFWPRNVLFEPRGGRGREPVSGVVDWERWAACGPVTGDLLDFAWTAARLVLGRRADATAQASLEQAFVAPTPLAFSVKRYLHLYCGRSGALEPADLWPLFELHVAERAVAAATAGTGDKEGWRACWRALIDRRRAGAGIPYAFSG